MSTGAPIPIARPDLDEREVEAVARVIRSGWVMQGPEVEAFEREFAAFVGTPHACAVSSGTAALELALAAAGVGPDDEVVVPSLSFVATTNVVRHRGATPVFVDVEPDGFNLDPALLASTLSRRTKAILCVHQLGMPCDLAAILAIARPRGIAVVEDAACAAGSEIRWDGTWQRIGRPHGDVACFSFHPRKLLTTGEGGMVTTSRPDLDARVRRLRNHGLARATKDAPESCDEAGWNFRMTDLQAAIGRVQLARLPDAVARRRSVAARYATLLRGVPGLGLPREPDFARTNWQTYCVSLPEGRAQPDLARAMAARGVATRPGVGCAHLELAHADVPHGPLPRSESARDGCLMLPIFPRMTDEEQDRVVAALREALAGPR